MSRSSGSALVASLILLGAVHCSDDPSRRGDDTPDAGRQEVDAGEVDAGEVDAGEVDAGEVDAGEVDAGEIDAGEEEETPDAGGDWEPVLPSTSMVQARSSHASVTLADGRVLVIDGLPYESEGPLVEVFDPSTETWSAPEMTDAPENAGDVAYLMENGEVAVGSTTYSSNVAFFDPVTGVWREGSLSGVSSSDPFATMLPSGRAVAGGGWRTGGYSVGTTASYDPATDEWISGGMCRARRSALAAPVSDRFALIVGGRTGLSELFSAELIDATTGESRFTGSPLDWSLDAEFVALSGGDVLMTGGNDDNRGAVGHVERWSFATGKWSLAQPMATPRFAHTLTLLDDGRVLAIGGRTDDYEELSSIELYDPAIDQWRKVGDLATPRYEHAAALMLDGRVLVTGGHSDFDAITDVEIIDLAASCAAAGSCECEPESDNVLCRRHESRCATGALVDRCGDARIVSCALETCADDQTCASAPEGSSRCVETLPAGSRWHVEEASSGNYFQQVVDIGTDARGWPTLLMQGQPVGGSVSAEGVALNTRRPSGRWVREGLAIGEGRFSASFAPGRAPNVLQTRTSTVVLTLFGWAGNAWNEVETYELDGRDFTGQALVVDPANRASVAFVEQFSSFPGDVRYATFGDELVTQQVDKLGGPSAIDAALDSSGEPHLVYVDPDTGLKHAAREGGILWSKELVDPDGGRNARVSFDASGTEHLVYRDADENHVLKHATRQQGGWTIDTWPLPAADISQPLFAVDSAGKVHAVWSSSPANTVFYAVHEAAGWDVETVFEIPDATTLVPRAFAFDGEDRPLIAIRFSWSTYFATTR